MKKLILFALAIGAMNVAAAQDNPQVYLDADLTSAYLWRGQKNAGWSIQPVVGIKWKGGNFYIWGNEQLSPPAGQPVKHEIDFFLKYNVTPYLNVGLKDVYVNTRGDGFFSFGPIPHAANGLDVLLSCNLKYVNLDWSTTIAGYDGYDHHGNRSYGSYLAINAPFSWLQLDWNAQVGIVPYYCSRYSDDVSDGFHVNSCALKVAKKFSITKADLDVSPYFQFMVNPSARTSYFQVGVKCHYQTP